MFQLVAIYDLLEDRLINDITDNFFTLLYKTNRFHVVSIDHRRGQNVVRTSVTHSPLLFVLNHFEIICDLLLNRFKATWNLFINVKGSHLQKIITYFNILASVLTELLFVVVRMLLLLGLKNFHVTCDWELFI